MRTATATLTILTTLFAFAAADTIYDIPKCAQQCFITAVGSSQCGLTDAYCQCTTGANQIRKDTISCLCESTCTTTDLMKAQQVSNSICSSAVAASSQTYEATTVGLEVCQATGAAGSGSGSGSGTTTAASSDASTTGGSSGSDSQSASASASQSVESQSGNAAAPAVTGMVGFQGAVMGVIGLGLMAL